MCVYVLKRIWNRITELKQCTERKARNAISLPSLVIENAPIFSRTNHRINEIFTKCGVIVWLVFCCFIWRTISALPPEAMKKLPRHFLHKTALSLHVSSINGYFAHSFAMYLPFDVFGILFILDIELHLKISKKISIEWKKLNWKK